LDVAASADVAGGDSNAIESGLICLLCLTDPGLTPYRGIKKLRDAGALEPDGVMATIVVGGLGAYAVQYASYFPQARRS
jgi:hypothetical protein